MTSSNLFDIPLLLNTVEARILITGGTGFIGRSVLDQLLVIASKRSQNMRIDVLSRAPLQFLHRYPKYANHAWLSIIEGSLDKLPMGQRYTHIIHGAAETHWEGDSLNWLEQLVDGTHQVLAFAQKSHVQKMLFLSSGAVYGTSTNEVPLKEDQPTAPLTTDTTALYGHGKRMAETICTLYSEKYHVPCVIARCFTVISEHVPLDGPYAIGNFLRDAIDPQQKTIDVKGTGHDIRTYIDGRDMSHWLLTILGQGTPGSAYNIGGNTPITTEKLAQIVRAVISPAKQVQVHGRGNSLAQSSLRSVYVPSIDHAHSLGLEPTITLKQAITHAAHHIKGRLNTHD